MTLTIYRINQYQAYRADEQGVHFSLEAPGRDTPHYKSEHEAIDIELPEGFYIIKICDGDVSQLKYGEYDVLIGEDKRGIYLEICLFESQKVYPKIIKRR